MRKKWIRGIIAYLVLVFICVIIVYALPSVKGLLVRTYIAEQGQIEFSDEVQLCLVRDELVYLSSKSRRIDRVIDKGELVKANTQAVKLSGSGAESKRDKYSDGLKALGDAAVVTDAGNCGYSGYICYKFDGAEGKLTPETMYELTPDELKDYEDLDLISMPSNECAKGEPVFKLVRNEKWYMVFFVEKKDAEKYYEGGAVTVEIDGQEVGATVKSITDCKKQKRVILSCGQTFNGFLTDRCLSAKVVVSRASGLLIKKESIIKNGDTEGVLVKNKYGKYDFMPVKIKASDEESCIVYQDMYMDEESNFVETISIYDEIMKSPKKSDLKNAN